MNNSNCSQMQGTNQKGANECRLSSRITYPGQPVGSPGCASAFGALCEAPSASSTGGDMFGLRLPFRRGLKSEADIAGDASRGGQVTLARRAAPPPPHNAPLARKAMPRPKGFPDWGKLTSRGRSWAGRQPGRRGRVLIATNIGGHGPVSMMESMLAAALAVRDADVEIVLCDGILPGCLSAEHSDLPDPAVLADRKLPKRCAHRASGAAVRCSSRSA